MAVLEGAELDRQLAELGEWQHSEASLRRTLTFADFSEAWGFMARVALVAEKLNHHPDWSNSWNTVEMAITSHDEGGLTEQCVDFARRVNDILGET
ncbi:MAG: 4a-hydroxytetrahydrobiopterin dehydratase [Acidimicrobiia bacterium]|nr:4a-hydroxytetrahydrobiopterin dehydratase [Acidimicrobiia bacterium]